MVDGVQYFTPQASRGKFMQMKELQPDQRFAEPSTSISGNSFIKNMYIHLAMYCNIWTLHYMYQGAW